LLPIQRQILAIGADRLFSGVVDASRECPEDGGDQRVARVDRVERVERVP